MLSCHSILSELRDVALVPRRWFLTQLGRKRRQQRWILPLTRDKKAKTEITLLRNEHWNQGMYIHPVGDQKYMGRENQGGDWSGWHCHIDQIWQLLLVMRSTGKPLKASSLWTLGIDFSVMPPESSQNYKVKAAMISLPQQLLNQNPNNYSHRLEQHKNSLVDFFQVTLVQGEKHYFVYQGIFLFIGEFLFVWLPECEGYTSFRSPDHLVMQRARMAESHFAARNPP